VPPSTVPAAYAHSATRQEAEAGSKPPKAVAADVGKAGIGGGPDGALPGRLTDWSINEIPASRGFRILARAE